MNRRDDELAGDLPDCVETFRLDGFHAEARVVERAAASLAALEAENARLREALQELVYLKERKDAGLTQGLYATRKPLAWEAARAALTREAGR